MTRFHPPQPLRVGTGRIRTIELALTGTIAGDCLARALMSTDYTMPEPTHELQVLTRAGDWECTDVGSERKVANLVDEHELRLLLGKSRWQAVRAVPRVPR